MQAADWASQRGPAILCEHLPDVCVHSTPNNTYTGHGVLFLLFASGEACFYPLSHSELCEPSPSAHVVSSSGTTEIAGSSGGSRLHHVYDERPEGFYAVQLVNQEPVQ
eukprot:TRINITY_DN3429_c0_g1_i1.p2 TRINITY_DN3429_c0_g1~~TRINITY_DN3429_c0_g1_i1.p2  ORF type:complete len:108 (-),score=13.30 TRINITY_DN3429_c0_g1_i1:135-458(-)